MPMTASVASSGRRSQKRQSAASARGNPSSSALKTAGKTVNVRANERMLFILSQLKNNFGVSMSESLRKGLSLFFIAKQQEKQGRKLVFLDKDGNVAVELESL
jgi:hypothetical protein